MYITGCVWKPLPLPCKIRGGGQLTDLIRRPIGFKVPVMHTINVFDHFGLSFYLIFSFDYAIIKTVSRATMAALTRTLPASWFCSSALYQLERRAVFLKVGPIRHPRNAILISRLVLASTRACDPFPRTRQRCSCEVRDSTGGYLRWKSSTRISRHYQRWLDNICRDRGLLRAREFGCW